MISNSVTRRLRRGILRLVWRACQDSSRQKLLDSSLNMKSAKLRQDPGVASLGNLTACMLLFLVLGLLGRPMGLVGLVVHFCAFRTGALRLPAQKSHPRSTPSQFHCRAPEIFGRQIFGACDRLIDKLDTGSGVRVIHGGAGLE